MNKGKDFGRVWTAAIVRNASLPNYSVLERGKK